MLKKRLEYNGFHCVSIFTIEAALSNLKRIHPDLVLLDLGFPEDDGMTFLKQAKRYIAPSSHLPPIIVMSSHDDKAVVNQALARGAKGFLPKPYDAELLMDMIETSLDEEDE